MATDVVGILRLEFSRTLANFQAMSSTAVPDPMNQLKLMGGFGKEWTIGNMPTK